MLERGDPAASKEIDEWVEAAHVAHVMEHNHLGLMGHYYGGMLDIYSDLTLQCAIFGGHIQMIEVEEFASLIDETTEPEISARLDLFSQCFEVQPDCSKEELQRSARTSVALRKLVAKHSLGSLAYYHSGTGNGANENALSSIMSQAPDFT